MDIPILYEDDAIVVIDKPSGVVCNRAETVKEQTIQDWMDQRYQIPDYRLQDDSGQYFVERSGLVHRLDKETSGVMILAKTPEAFVELLRQFRERLVHKTYLALTHGIWSAKQGEISLPIGRRRDNRQRMGVREDGRESVTAYTVRAEYHKYNFPQDLKVEERGYTGFSWVEFRPQTGRMHQIRVHARHVGHPVVGDEQYAGRKRSREDRKWVGRVMLQAQSLELAYPLTHERMRWEAKGQDLQQILRYFEVSK